MERLQLTVFHINDKTILTGFSVVHLLKEDISHVCNMFSMFAISISNGCCFFLMENIDIRHSE